MQVIPKEYKKLLGTILLTQNERRVAEDRPDCYSLYVVTNCASAPELQEPVRNPARFPWHTGHQGAALLARGQRLTQPMQVSERPLKYNGSQ